MRAWSHSALKSFEQCPKKFYRTAIAKDVKEAESEAMQWGSNVHKAFEEYFKKGKPFPMGMKHLGSTAEQLDRVVSAADETFVELKLALNKDFQPRGFFDKDVWVRCVLDFGVRKGSTALLFDHKTGRKQEDDDQLALMAAVMFAQDPQIQTIKSAFVWLKEPPGKRVESHTFERRHLGEIWNRFLPRVEAFQEAYRKDEYPPRPSGLCRKYCPVTSCPYHGT